MHLSGSHVAVSGQWRSPSGPSVHSARSGRVIHFKDEQLGAGGSVAYASDSGSGSGHHRRVRRWSPGWALPAVEPAEGSVSPVAFPLWLPRVRSLSAHKRLIVRNAENVCVSNWEMKNFTSLLFIVSRMLDNDVRPVVMAVLGWVGGFSLTCPSRSAVLRNHFDRNPHWLQGFVDAI